MTSSPRHSPETHADICLLLEGTYPFIRGGVSTWVKQLIEGMPELTFSIIFLGTKEDDYGEPAYELPDNLVHIQMFYLLDETEAIEKSPSLLQKLKVASRKDKEKYAVNEDMHTLLADDAKSDSDSGGISTGQADASFDSNFDSNQIIRNFTRILSGDLQIDQEELHYGRESWETIRRKYLKAPPGLDFNHYFWSIRGMHKPLFTIGKAAENPPSADLYHSVSTGYAGFLGAMLQSKSGKPFIISEHGIYTKERELDIAQVDWIPDEFNQFQVGLNEEMGYLRSIWIRFFKSLGRMSYASASQVYTLYNGNRLRQISDGCPEDKLEIIPNGVDIEKFKSVRRNADAEIPPVLGLIGRVVPIKDIKNFIRAMRVIRETLPDAQGWLIGPQDEDEDYFEECKLLVENLELENTVVFKGFQNPTDMFPQLGLNVLTSVSEGQPLTTLEGYAAGIPALTTDVGSCSELICGVSEEDRAIGTSGAVVPISNPTLFAEAALELLTDREKWSEARDAAIERVETFYSDKEMIGRYRQIYQGYLQNASAAKRKAS